MTLVEAMPHLSGLPVKLVLVGPGPSQEELGRRAEELGVADRVILTGKCSPEEVAVLLKQADVFSLASYHFDNQPMVFLEAAACGLPFGPVPRPVPLVRPLLQQHLAQRLRRST